MGVFATHYYLPPGQVVFKTPAHLSDAMVAGANCALAEVSPGLAAVGLHMGETVVTQAQAVSACTRAPLPSTLGPER